VLGLLAGRKRLKGKVLRAVWEDNRRILGRLPLAQRRRLLGARELLGTLVFVLSSFALVGSLNIAALDSEPGPAVSLKGPVAPQEYAPLLRKVSIPLRSLFGLEVKTIVIDPGHGGEDPGAIGRLGLKEKDITLDIARRLKRRLQGRFRVVLTREDDRTVPLRQRVEVANAKRADLFISIHVNSLPDRKPLDIIETYYFGPPEDEATLQVAARENAGSDYALSDYQELFLEMGNTLKLQESKMLATSIQESLYVNIRAQKADVIDRGVKRAPFLVLLGARVPAVLAEVSCLSNPEEERRLAQPSYRESIARFLEAGILQYLNQSARRVSL
jgi:N-acetylmuramoyl-L-alanine amidase